MKASNINHIWMLIQSKCKPIHWDMLASLTVAQHSKCGHFCSYTDFFMWKLLRTNASNIFYWIWMLYTIRIYTPIHIVIYWSKLTTAQHLHCENLVNIVILCKLLLRMKALYCGQVWMHTIVCINNSLQFAGANLTILLKNFNPVKIFGI